MGNSPQRQHGVTLIEVMVILVILGFSAALLLPNLFPDDKQVARHEAQRLAETLQHAALAAQSRGEDIVWSVDPRGYQFWLGEPGSASLPPGGVASASSWRGLRDDDVLAPRTLPPGTQAHLVWIASQPASRPWLVFRADGLNEPYAVEVGNSRARVWVRSDPLNRVSLADPQP